jgi:hypothetical protein
MKPDTLLKLYPKPWRDRYGAEFVALLQKEGTGTRVVLNVMAGAFDAWTSPRTGGEMALDGSIGPGILSHKLDTKNGLYSGSHWLHILGAIVAGLAVHGIGQLVHPGRFGPLSFLAGFLAAVQLWNFRFFSLRTRMAAVFWAFVFSSGAVWAVHTFLHRVVYPWFDK